MTYFRVKRRRLGATFERFIRDPLAPGGTLLLADCGLRWPTTRVGERHLFQFGGVGGLPAAEYLEGSERLARAGGYRVERLAFARPDDLSAPVAELYRRWYAESGEPARRLLVESFVLLDPWLAVRTRSVPFWTTFGTEPAREVVRRYLATSEPYPEIAATLFAHGVASVGVAPRSAGARCSAMRSAAAG